MTIQSYSLHLTARQRAGRFRAHSTYTFYTAVIDRSTKEVGSALWKTRVVVHYRSVEVSIKAIGKLFDKILRASQFGGLLYLLLVFCIIRVTNTDVALNL